MTRNGETVNWITARRRHPLAGYAVVILALALFGVGYSAVVPNADRAQAQALADDAETYTDVDLSNGRDIYTATCASCHGDFGEGSYVLDGSIVPATDIDPDDIDRARPAAPSLDGVGAASVNFQVTTGRMPSMDPDTQSPRKPPAPIFQDEQNIADLAAYVQEEFGGGPEVPLNVPGEAPSRTDFPPGEEGQHDYEEAAEEFQETLDAYVAGGNIDAGQTLYLTNCAHCHSWSGSGGALTDGAFAPPLHESSARQIYEAMLTGPGAMPVFAEGTLTPQEKNDIITHVKELQMEPDAGGIFSLGRVGQAAEGFVGWTVGMGLIVAAAIWITAKQRAHD